MAAALTAPARPTAGESSLLTLEVPYFSQRDSATAQGDRMCFSSSCAMAAEFLKPDCLAGAGQRDDRYLALVQHFGDTTNSQAQVAALRRLGIQATFRTDGRVGWLHHEPVESPRGGWVCHHRHWQREEPALLRAELGPAVDGGGCAAVGGSTWGFAVLTGAPGGSNHLIRGHGQGSASQQPCNRP